MPSRHSRKAKSTVSSYDEKKKQQNPTISKKKTAQSTPTIDVTDASPSDLILHSSWKVLYIFQFLTLFRQQLNLPSITIDELESILLFCPNDIEGDNDISSSQHADQTDDNGKSSNPSSRESSIVNSNGIMNEHEHRRSTAKLIVPLLVSLFDDRKHKLITDSNYPEQIYKYMYHHSVDEGVQEILGRYPDRIDFTTISLLDKICILKELVDCIFETGMALQWKNNLQPEEMRVSSMGKDSDGWTYYAFGDSRLYREMAINPRKKETDYTFELIATTQDEWQKWMDKFSPNSSKPQERSLAQELQTHGAMVIMKFETRKAAKLREEAKLERAKKFDMLPRKRSRRIEVKSEEDDRRRQLEELERAQVEYEELQKEHERRVQEELTEKEKQSVVIEDARLKEQVYQILGHMVSQHQHAKRLLKEPSTNDDISEDQDDDRIRQLKSLRTKLKKNATHDEILEKLAGWATLLDDNYKVATNMTEPLLIVENSDGNQGTSGTGMSNETIAHSLDNATFATGSTTNGNIESPYQSTLSSIAPMSTTSQPPQQQEPVLNASIPLPIKQSTNENCNNIHQSSIPSVPSGSEQPMAHQSTDQQMPLALDNQRASATSDEQQKPANESSHSLATLDVSLGKASQPTTADTPTLQDTLSTVAISQSSNTIESTNPPITTATNNGVKAPTVAKRGRPRKPKQPVVNTKALLPSFSDALQFTGNGTKSDLRDPLLKLILSTMMAQIRQHPIVTEPEQRNEKKTGKKRKTAPAPTSTGMTFYTIHKKLLLNQYGGETGNKTVADVSDGNQATASTADALGTVASDEKMASVGATINEEIGTTDGTGTNETKDSVIKGGSNYTGAHVPSDEPSGFDNWLKDMDLLLKSNDSSSLELKNFTYSMFDLVFRKEKVD